MSKVVCEERGSFTIPGPGGGSDREDKQNRVTRTIGQLQKEGGWAKNLVLLPGGAILYLVNIFPMFSFFMFFENFWTLDILVIGRGEFFCVSQGGSEHFGCMDRQFLGSLWVQKVCSVKKR